MRSCANVKEDRIVALVEALPWMVLKEAAFR